MSDHPEGDKARAPISHRKEVMILVGALVVAACSLLMGITGVSFLSFMVLAPAMYVEQLGWEIVTAGYSVGISASMLVVASQVANPLMRMVGMRATVITGSLVTATGWYLFSGINLNVSPAQVIVPGAFICFGLLITFPVIAAQAFAHVPPQLRDEAAGLFNLVKTIGFSFGVTFVTALIYRGTQENWSRIAGFLDPTRPGYSYYLQQAGIDDGTPEAGALLFQIMESQSSILTYTHTMEVLALIVICSIPLTFFMRTKTEAPPARAAGASAH